MMCLIPLLPSNNPECREVGRGCEAADWTVEMSFHWSTPALWNTKSVHFGAKYLLVAKSEHPAGKALPGLKEQPHYEGHWVGQVGSDSLSSHEPILRVTFWRWCFLCGIEKLGRWAKPVIFITSITTGQWDTLNFSKEKPLLIIDNVGTLWKVCFLCRHLNLGGMNARSSFYLAINFIS